MVESRGQLRWGEAAVAIADGDFLRAARVLEQIGAPGEAAYARLRAAQAQQPGAGAQLPSALAFLRAEGASSAESWPAIRYDQFLALHDNVEAEHGSKPKKKK